MDAQTTLEGKPLAWATWRATLVLTLAVLAARVVFLLVSPLELTGDEAHYWEWSRRLDLSYYSKGPGVAWTIWATTHLFGDTAWAVRLGAALSGAVTMLVLAQLGRDCSDGDDRVGFFAALAFVLAPGFAAMNLLMTIDGPYLMCWALASWAAYHVTRRIESGGNATGPMIAFAAALGVGFLYKYTILLLIPGLLIYLLIRRRRLRVTGANALGVLLALVVFAAVISPVIIWNAREGWPTVRHLIGAIGLPGGDMSQAVANEHASYSPVWTLELIGAQIGLMGPPLFTLIVASVVWAMRNRGGNRDEPSGWPAELLMICIGTPVLVFYFVISFIHETQGNWPVAGFVTLLVLVARRVVGELPRYHDMVRDWLALAPDERPKMGLLRQKPETVWQVAWHWTVAFGIGAQIVIVAIAFATASPMLQKTKLIGRLYGTEPFAAALADEIHRVEQKTGVEPIVIADRYGEASLLAFYLPGHPRVFCAQRYFGDRASQYDFFADTNLADPALIGRPAVVMRSSQAAWQRAFVADTMDPIELPESSTRGQRWRQSDNHYYVIWKFGGLKADPSDKPDSLDADTPR
ncbi:MAG: phospholipid carrier-dependent glycosyltransferase [Phycisphaera sp.]|nr:phospholipid carrier-dependent glycosyltransferase [Phycisphaera sp.]